jgi:hypothetical protein
MFFSPVSGGSSGYFLKYLDITEYIMARKERASRK